MNEKECSVLSLTNDDTHACWEVSASNGVEAVDAWALWFHVAATSRGGYHDRALFIRIFLLRVFLRETY